MNFFLNVLDSFLISEYLDLNTGCFKSLEKYFGYGELYLLRIVWYLNQFEIFPQFRRSPADPKSGACGTALLNS